MKVYDDTKRASDFFNKQLVAFTNPHTPKKGERTLLIGRFEMARTNAYILWGIVHPDSMGHKEFVLEVAASLLAGQQE